MCRLATNGMICLLFSAVASVLTVASAHAGPLFYVSDKDGALATVNASTGKVSMIGSMGVVMTDIALAPDGDLWGISFDALYRIDRRTAEATWVGRHDIPQGNALTFSPYGDLFAAGSGSTKLYSIDPLTGSASVYMEVGFAAAGDLAYELDDMPFAGPPSHRLYMTSTDGDLVAMAMSVFGGAAVLVGDVGTRNMYGLERGPDGTLYGFAGKKVFAIDKQTASTSLLSSFGGQGLKQVFGATSVEVPEPASAILAAFAGFAALALIAGRKRRRADTLPSARFET